MPPIVFVVAQFALCAAVIVFAGVRLSRYGDVSAEKSGAGGTSVGLTLLATVTSLPELVSGASGILLFDVPDIAVGNALGACLFNLLILALLDASHPVPLSARIHQGHVLAAGFVVINLGVVAASFVAGPRAPSLGSVGLSSVIMVALYALAMRTIIRFERIRLEARLDEIAEVVVSVTAVRLGAIDMAAANLFGSILFNVALLAFDDLLAVYVLTLVLLAT